MCVVITFSRLGINRVWLPILLVVSSTGKTEFALSPRSRLRIWSHKLVSAVPSRVSPLILHSTPRLNLVLTYGTPLPLSATASIRTVMLHRASPEFIIFDGVHYRESAGTEPVAPS